MEVLDFYVKPQNRSSCSNNTLYGTIASLPDTSKVISYVEDGTTYCFEEDEVLKLIATEKNTWTGKKLSDEFLTKLKREKVTPSDRLKYYLSEKEFHEKFGKKDKQLGKGAYGEVYSTDKGFAYKRQKYRDHRLTQFEINEPALSMYMNHPNLSRSLGIYLGNTYALTAMEKATGSMRGLNMRSKERPYYFYQILRGLAYMHSKHVWHLDLKPDNILTFPNKVLKITDFGLSIVYANPGGHNPSLVQTSWYRAPEVYRLEQRGSRVNYTSKADVWSVGIILHEYITGTFLLKDATDMDKALHKIFELVGYSDEWHETINISYNSKDKTIDGIPKKYSTSSDEMDLLKKLLGPPGTRISALDALAHPYFNSVRAEVERDIPAPNIVYTMCGDFMLSEQTKVRSSGWIPLTNRKTVIEWMWEVSDELDVKYSATLYSFLLLDEVMIRRRMLNEDMQSFGCACLAIAIAMFDSRNASIDELDSSLEYYTAGSTTAKNLPRYIKTVISTLDMRLVFPTCANFIVEYMVPSLHKSKKEMDKVYMVACILYFGDIPFRHTQAQIAQMAYELTSVPYANCVFDSNITDEIREYFNHYISGDNDIAKFYRNIETKEEEEEEEEEEVQEIVARVEEDMKRMKVKSPSKSPQEEAPKSLYDRLGGIYSIAPIVNQFSDALIYNSVVGIQSKNPFLREWHINKMNRLAGLKFMRTLWLCDVAGGPFKFHGTVPGGCPLSLENAHEKFKISPEEFDEVAAELANSLKMFSVPEKERGEVLAAFAAHKTEINQGYDLTHGKPAKPSSPKCPFKKVSSDIVFEEET